MARLLWACLLLFGVCANALRVLSLFPHPGRSHQIIFESLSLELARRGHEVTMVSIFPQKNPPANYTDVSLQELYQPWLANFDYGIVEENEKYVPHLFGLERILSQMNLYEVISDLAVSLCSKLMVHQPLKEVLQKEYDVILTENFNSDCGLGLLHVYGQKAPVVAVLSSNIMPWSAERMGLYFNPAYIPTASTCVTSRMNFWERLENTIGFISFKIWFYFKIRMPEQNLLEKHFERPVDLDAISKNTSLMLVNTFYSFIGVRPTVPGFVEVGGLHLKNTKAPLPQFMEKFLQESEHGVVLFSWGSLLKTSSIPKETEEIIVRALSKLPQRVIWKYEVEEPQGKLVGNILKVKWIPQYDLLRHEKVVAFLSHGGLLGSSDAMAEGKPVLVVPFFADQMGNAALLQEAGFGLHLDLRDITEHTFTRALHRILSPELRERAREASQRWRDRPQQPMDTAVYWVERVARWGAKDPLHSPARDMPFYQWALLDVIGFILIVAVLLFTLVYVLLRSLFRLVVSLFVTEPKKKRA